MMADLLGGNMSFREGDDPNPNPNPLMDAAAGGGAAGGGAAAPGGDFIDMGAPAQVRERARACATPPLHHLTT